MNNETNTKRENMYLEMISECKKIANNIRNKAGIIICPQVCEERAETPTRTELEGNLKQLVDTLKDLERDITT
mgnify:CR=1 FL=1